MARDYGARLIVLHVAEPLLDFHGTAPLAYGDEANDVAATENSKEHLNDKLRQIALAEPPMAVDCEVVEGHAAEEVIGHAQKLKVDLVVMETHGRIGVTRLLMGSVAEQVVRRAPCPVLTVKTPSVDS